jgi:hypothetical protein
MTPHRIRIALAVAVTALIGARPFASAQQSPTVDLDELVARAAAYVGDFVTHFANVVAEEHYLQEINYPISFGSGGRRGTPAQIQQRPADRRELKSDFLLVRTDEQSDYLIFRDVFEVDGRQVRDREQRLTSLFLNSSSAAAAADRATRVALEGSRYNLAGTNTTINTPLVAMAFLQDRFRSRFHLTLGKVDKNVGPDVHVVEFEDRSRPTIIRTENDTDLVSHGRFWIDAVTGRVLRTELNAGASRILTFFRFDDSFQIAVPIAMQEWVRVRGGEMTGNATYSKFRRFQVSSEEQLKQ